MFEIQMSESASSITFIHRRRVSSCENQKLVSPFEWPHLEAADPNHLGARRLRRFSVRQAAGHRCLHVRPVGEVTRRSRSRSGLRTRPFGFRLAVRPREFSSRSSRHLRVAQRHPTTFPLTNNRILLQTDPIFQCSAPTSGHSFSNGQWDDDGSVAPPPGRWGYAPSWLPAVRDIQAPPPPRVV